MTLCLNLVEQVIMLQQARTNQRNKNLTVNASNTSFGNIFSQSLKEIEERNVLPQKSLPEVDFYLPANDEEKFKKSLKFVPEKEGSKFVYEDGSSKESSKYGILQFTARAFGYKGNIKDMTRDQAERIYKKL